MKHSVLCASIAGLVATSTAPAAIIWDADDATIVFTRPDNADGGDPELWDYVRPDVALARDFGGPIYNAITFSGIEWAFSGAAGNASFAFGDGAQDHASLTFFDMAGALDNRIGALIRNRPGVLHLTDEDIYIDIRFTSWQSGGGGGFTYERAIPAPGSTGVLALAGLARTRRRRRRSDAGAARHGKPLTP